MLILAHGIGGRTDLPLPAWQLAWAAGFAVVVSFVAVGAFWSTPRLGAAARGRCLFSLRGSVARGGLIFSRVFGMVLFVVVLYAAWGGNPNGAVNVAPGAVFIWFWVGLQVVSVALGDGWRAFNPYLTIADSAAWLRAKIRGEKSGPVTETVSTLWPAVVAIFGYLWFELAYHSPDRPRAIAVFITLYSLLLLGGAAIRGRIWVREADGFAVLFSLLASLAPVYRDHRANLRLRLPLSGLSTVPPTAGTVPFIVVVLGATTFDGFTRSSIWLDLSGTRTGWSRSVVSTIGLLVVIGIVGWIYAFAVSWMANITGEQPAEVSRAFGPTLVPIAAAYTLAHYFSLLVLNGQAMIIRVSDPFGTGRDLFGTKDYAIDWTLVSPDTIAWVQTLAIAGGHVLAVAAAHDVAVSRYRYQLAVRSQYRLLLVMIAYTVLGLFLLLGA